MNHRRRITAVSRHEAGAQARRRRARAHLERVRNQRRRRPPSARVLALAVAGLSLSAGLLSGATGWLSAPVSGIRVLGTHRVAAEEIARAAGVARGTAPRALDRAALARRLGEHPWVASARVLLLPDGTLLLGVHERRPAALLVGEPPWVVDAAGRAFAPAPAEGREDLLRLRAAERPPPGATSPELARAVALARALPDLGLPAPREVAISAPDDPEGLSLVLPGLPARVVLGRVDLEARLADLARLLEARLPELEGATRIDLRFEDQAVLDGEPSLEGAEQAAAPRGAGAPSNSRRSG